MVCLWYNWVKDEQPEWLGKYVYNITINKSATIDITHKNPNKLLVITNDKDFITFSRRYGSSTWMINWAKDYGGIEICPYLPTIAKSNNKKYAWYHTWDVASGVVWNTKLISAITLFFERNNDKYVRTRTHK